MGFEHVTRDVDHFPVQKLHEVLATHVKHVVSRLIVLVHLHATSVEQSIDIVFAEERLSYFEAATAAEGSVNVVDAYDGVTDHVVVSTQHLWCELVQREDFAWADLSVVHLDTVTEEEFVYLLDLGARSENAFVSPKVFQIITTDPFVNLLVLVCQRCLEAVSWREVLLKLISRDQSISK